MEVKYATQFLSHSISATILMSVSLGALLLEQLLELQNLQVILLKSEQSEQICSTAQI